MNRTLFFVLATIFFLYSTAYSEKIIEDHYVKLSMSEFKEYLKNNQIIDVSKTNDWDLVGKFKENDGRILEFLVEQYQSDKPFVKDAIENGGLTLGRKNISKDYGYVGGTDIRDFLPYFFILLLLASCILNILLYSKFKKFENQINTKIND